MGVTKWKTELGRASQRLRERILAPTPSDIHYVNFAVTFLCNSRCRMCDIWQIYRGKGAQARTELSVSEIERVFRSPLLQRLRSISLTGGEVFLRRDFAEIVGFFLGHFPQAAITIPTGSINPELSGQVLRRILRDYRPEKGRLFLSVSLDGIGLTHDHQRGIRVFDKAMRVIEETLSLDGLRVGVSFTITRENWRDLPAVYRLAREKGLEFSAQFAQSSETYYATTNPPTGWRTEDLHAIGDALEEVIGEMFAQMSFRQRVTDVRAYYFQRMVDYQSHPRRIFTCYSGTHSFYLDPYGNVYPCITLNRKLGNVREQSFEDIWLGPQAQAIRQLIADRRCECWTPCEALPSLGRSPKPLLFNLTRRARRKARDEDPSPE